MLRTLASLTLLPIMAGIGSQKPMPAEKDVPAAWMVVLDISSSMTAEDFQPQSRLQAAKDSLREFISGNPGVELGLIIFAATPKLLAPLTSDHEAVLTALHAVRAAEYGEDGTAIGSGIASAINRLRGGTWAERRILLITDGVNNHGSVSPLDAARLARALQIQIHAVGIGTDSLSTYWVPSPQGTPIQLRARIEIDDAALQALARESDGTYQRVNNSVELRQALLSLKPGARSPQHIQASRQDFRWVRALAWWTLLLLVLEFVLAQFVFSVLPE